MCSANVHTIVISQQFDACLFVQVDDKPLICASANGNTKLVEYLLTFGANIDQKDRVININMFHLNLFCCPLYVVSYFVTERWKHCSDTGMPLQPPWDCKGSSGI